MKRNLILLAGLIGLGWILAACSGGEASSAASVNANATSVMGTAESALPLNASGEQIVARVNGAEITLTEFERLFNRSQSASNVTDYDVAMVAVLEALIEQALINQQAEALGITVTDAEVEAEFQSMRASLSSDAAWEQWLAQNWLTEAELRQSLRDSLTTQRTQMAISGSGETMVATIHARHILVETLEEATAILERLQAGEDFALLSAQFSQDPNTRNNGGDLGWFTRNDLTVPELADFALQLQPGTPGGPFQTILGFHIVETLEVGQRPVTSEELAGVSNEQFNAWLATTRANATIERYIP